MMEIDQIWQYYENIKESLDALKIILDINLNERNIYYQAGMDNLKALNENIIEILKASSSPREVRIKLRELEFDEREAQEESIIE